MRHHRELIFGVFGALAVVLAVLHSPGEMSVDSVMALYEAMKGEAIGWGPTFMASTLKWLGGGAIGSSLFVGLICVLTYGCFAALLAVRQNDVPKWQLVTAFVLALNPLFMFYVGIVWKDVMQATFAMVAATSLLLAATRNGRSRYGLLLLAALATGVLMPIRQQGFLIALPFTIAIGCMAASGLYKRFFARAAIFSSAVVFVFACNGIFYWASVKTVKPPPRSQFATGIYTIQAYDIAGMITDAKAGDPSTWSGAPSGTIEAIKQNYSPERIDTIWHLKPVRDYFNHFSAGGYMATWLAGIKHNPAAYAESRLGAFAELLGLRSIKGCVPAFWGVGALPDQVAALGLQNGMDARARLIGRTAENLYETPVFRNWFYATLLLMASLVAIFRIRGERRFVACVAAIGAWLYWWSFLPTTIACDFRYLYPVAAIATALSIHILANVDIWRRRRPVS